MLVKVYALKKKKKIEPEEVNEPFKCRNQSLKPCLCIYVLWIFSTFLHPVLSCI